MFGCSLPGAKVVASNFHRNFSQLILANCRLASFKCQRRANWASGSASSLSACMPCKDAICKHHPSFLVSFWVVGWHSRSWLATAVAHRRGCLVGRWSDRTQLRRGCSLRAPQEQNRLRRSPPPVCSQTPSLQSHRPDALQYTEQRSHTTASNTEYIRACTNAVGRGRKLRPTVH